MNTKDMIIRALFATILCITAPFSIAIGPVPVTFAVFFLAFTAFVTGSKNAVWSTVIYILIGMIGLPVFSGFKGGLSVIMSPTGGFIISYVFVAWILGQSVKCKNKMAVVALSVLAMFVCYLFGTVWFIFITKSNILAALTMCVVPFIPIDAVKLVLAYIVAQPTRKALMK
ncbi:MAG: biotin transporter BioY [Clostridia bacterium]